MPFRTFFDEDVRLVGYTFVAHGLLHGTALSLPIFIPIWFVEFEATRYQLGLGMSVMFALYGIAAIPIGTLSDRYGSDRFVTLFLVGTGVSLFLARFVTGFTGLVFVLALLGTSFGLYHAPALSLISRKATSPSRAFGYHGVATTLGNGLGPLFMTVGLSYADWRTLLGVLAVPFLAFAALFHLRGPDDSDRDSGTATGSHAKQVMTVFSVVFVAILLLYGFKGIYQRGTLTFLPDFLRLASDLSSVGLFGKEIPPERWVYTTILLVGGIGPVTAGYLGEFVRSEWLLAGIFATTGALLWSLGGLSGLPLLVATAGFAVLVFAVIPLQQNLVNRYVSEGKLGAGYGIIFFSSHAVGGLGPTLAGWLATRGSYAYVFKSLGAFTVGALLVVLFVELAGDGGVEVSSLATGREE